MRFGVSMGVWAVGIPIILHCWQNLHCNFSYLAPTTTMGLERDRSADPPPQLTSPAYLWTALQPPAVGPARNPALSLWAILFLTWMVGVEKKIGICEGGCPLAPSRLS
jgi:hypothetical protein